MAIEQSVLDGLWDFSDPAASERRLTAAASAAAGSDRAELETQVARSLGLQGRFEAAEGILDGLTAESAPPVLVRCRLERGRLRNSAGEPAAALPLFARAAELARAYRLTFLLVDALHMLAIADLPRAGEWTADGLAEVKSSSDPRVKRWAVTLYNNAGWRKFNAGELDEALELFEQAHGAAVHWGTDQQVVWAGEAIEECREALAADDTPDAH